jgi:hypothetical protein
MVLQFDMKLYNLKYTIDTKLCFKKSSGKTKLKKIHPKWRLIKTWCKYCLSGFVFQHVKSETFETFYNIQTFPCNPTFKTLEFLYIF